MKCVIEKSWAYRHGQLLAFSVLIPLLLLLSSLLPVRAAIVPSVDRQQQLLHLLKHDCGSCHGMTMKGGLGPALLPATLKDKSEEFLVHTVLEGRSGTPMPPWREMLSRDEAAWIINTLRQGLK